MELFWLIVIVVIVIVVYNTAHRAGKRLGSRKAYGVGYARGKRSKSQSGCVVVLLATIAVGAAGAVFALL